MWPTLDGLRRLRGAEAELVRQAAEIMLDRLVDEHRAGAEATVYGIDWFDQWDVDGRIWLLEQVLVALLTDQPPPPAAAIWEAAIDAIFCEVVEQITLEIDPFHGNTTWRQRVTAAFEFQYHRRPGVAPAEKEIRLWRPVVTQVADAILGVPAYQKAEAFRDGDIRQCRRFLTQRGLPDDFLERIPPLRSPAQTQASIANITAVLQK